MRNQWNRDQQEENMKERIKLMAHLVAGYPTDSAAMTAAHALIKGGASILEIQLPFSDPSADGPAIQGACSKVLSRGYRTRDGLDFISRIHADFPELTIYIMSYASLVYTPGIDRICKEAAEAGVKGMIIPDLPFDHDEGLSAACGTYGMENIPVAASSMALDRLSTLSHYGFAHIYAALRTGITGSDTTIDVHTISFLNKVSEGGSGIYGGFGIRTGSQAKMLAKNVDAVVAGSVFVRLITDNAGNEEALAKAIENKARELTGI